jgi:FkbH-like protein
MLLRRSSFVHLIDLADGSALALHAVSQLRLTVTRQVATVIGAFDVPRESEEAETALAASLGADAATIGRCIALLTERGILCAEDDAAERVSVTRELSPVHGRDPATQLDRYRRTHLEGSDPAWAVAAPLALSAQALTRRLDVLLLGDCDVQMEADFLRQEAARRGIDLRVAASFAADVDLAGERRHDAVIVGALQARHAIAVGEARHHEGDPARVYVDAVAALVDRLRVLTDAPILIDGLPEPTLQPMGMADRGVHAHRNRFRRANLPLAEFVGTRPDILLVDVAAAFGAVGAAALVDDWLVSFTHFGAPGWMLQRPESELKAVHKQFPDLQPLADMLGGDPYQREQMMARVHMDMLSIVLDLDRRKCVIVDLDGVLWPGVLAETGKPFAWEPEISGPNSYAGLYFGIHEALLTLKRRGILLACVSKNDEATVRELWRYTQAEPRHRLLRPEDFVCTRINWQDKAENIRAIAEELGFALDAFVFVDDSARERERVRQALPQVAVLGENLFTLRRSLLTDPALQPLHVTAEAAERSNLMRAKLQRARLRIDMPDEQEFLDSLQVSCRTKHLVATDDAALARVSEVFARTTQCNATGRRFSEAELRGVIGRADGRVMALWMRDRLADHGLVGAAVMVAGEILNLVISCRVIGLGGEARLLAALAADPGDGVRLLTGRIVPTGRNLPVRHLYSGNGYAANGEQDWALALHTTTEAAA